MYKHRLKILLIFIALMFTVVLVRLGYMQIVRGDFYRQQAERSLESVQLLPSYRGRILDRNGVILAEDEACHDFCLDYRFIAADPRWIRARVREIAKAEGMDPRDEKAKAWATQVYDRRARYTWQLTGQIAAEFGLELPEVLGRVCRGVQRVRQAVGRDVREQRMAHAVIRGLDERQVNSLRPLMPETIGASIVPSHQRRYPFGATACHIIGVTGPVFRKEMERWNLTAHDAGWLKRMRSNYLPGDTIGKMGVEKMAERLLRPKRGFRRFERIDEVTEEVPARPGGDIQLSIDIELQAKLTQLLAGSGHTGSLVVLSVPKGEVLAMVSWPTYDLNAYRQNYSRLVGDTVNLPLHNRAVTSVYAPGSTIKPITALAGLGAGKITPDTTITCNGENPYSRNGKPRCWYRSGHGPLELVAALRKSCNSYFVTVGHWLGAKMLVYWMRDFGFGQKPGTGLPEERSGVIGTEAWLRRYRDRGFVPSDAWNFAIGQGVFSASVLHVANAHATIARNGVFLSPLLVAEGGPPQTRRELPLPQLHMDAVAQGMYEVVNVRGGTAYRYFRQGIPLGVEICGKTGTAQVPPMRIDSNKDGRIDRRDVIVKQGNHAWFAGFGPYRRPQIAFAVLLEYAGSGGRNAGPIAKEVVRICKEFGYVTEGG
ncbi:MAG: hypothetical protein K8S55_11030 [Phycisphaerae bacterium]|nr:hypothetical protein [Phycisphaerae bacterium]